MKLPTWFAFCQLGFFPGKQVREVCRQTDRSIAAGGNKGRSPGGRPPPLFLEQTEARKAIKNLGETGSPHLSKGLDGRPPALSQGLVLALSRLLL